MKLLLLVITTVCLVATFNAGAIEQGTTKCLVNQPANAELQLLQGKWKGGEAADDERDKITITITGNSFHFHRDTNFWFETTITLLAGTDPQQFRATIKRCAPAQGDDNIGEVVPAIFKIEDGTLTIAVSQGPAGPPKSFEDKEATRYELRKVQPQKKDIQSPKTKKNRWRTPTPLPLRIRNLSS